MKTEINKRFPDLKHHKQFIYDELLNLSDEIDDFLRDSCLTDELRNLAHEFAKTKRGGKIHEN